MSEALERLKEIGAQKIYEDTHITVEHVQAILYESFEGMNKVQFTGFISILEREYGEDLSSVRSSGIRYFDEKDTSNISMQHTLFNAPDKKKNNIFIYIIVGIILLAAVLFYTTQPTNSVKVEENNSIAVADSNISKNKSVIENNSSDENISVSVVEANSTTLAMNTQESLKTDKAVVHTLKIVARARVWLGYIDVETNKKYQKTFVGEFDFNPSREWLFYFGHGYVDVIIDGKKEQFDSKYPLRLHYKNGKIEKITAKEFRKLNRGNKW